MVASVLCANISYKTLLEDFMIHFTQTYMDIWSWMCFFKNNFTAISRLDARNKRRSSNAYYRPTAAQHLEVCRLEMGWCLHAKL